MKEFCKNQSTFLARSANLPEGLYICNCFLRFFFHIAIRCRAVQRGTYVHERALTHYFYFGVGCKLVRAQARKDASWHPLSRIRCERTFSRWPSTGVNCSEKAAYHVGQSIVTPGECLHTIRVATATLAS